MDEKIEEWGNVEALTEIERITALRFFSDYEFEKNKSEEFAALADVEERPMRKHDLISKAIYWDEKAIISSQKLVDLFSNYNLNKKE